MNVPTGVYQRKYPPWNRGLTKETDPRINYERPTKFKKGNKVNLGRRPSAETLEALRLANTGRKHSKETIEKRAAALRGIPRSEETKRKISETNKAGWASGKTVSWIKGKNLSEEHKKRIGDAHRGKYMGPKASNWRGGISFAPYGLEWTSTLRRSIRERDGHCMFPGCGTTERLAVHHIDYNKMNCDPPNLITLCVSHNPKVNFNRSYWEGYFNGVIAEV